MRCNSGKWTTLTVNSTDTIYSIDTIYFIDSIHTIDSIFIRDTVQGLDGKNGKSCSAKDTVSSAGVKGYNLDCGSERIGTIWNGRDGLSAYEIAVQNGYEGSEEEAVQRKIGTISIPTKRMNCLPIREIPRFIKPFKSAHKLGLQKI